MDLATTKRSPSSDPGHPLSHILRVMEAQNDTLSKARNAYLTKEAQRKYTEAVLVRKAQGKSHAEKMINAQATKDWLEFHTELARLEAIYEFQRLKWEILDKEFQAQYLTLKTDAPMSRRAGL